jgi:hypothetical protein
MMRKNKLRVLAAAAAAGLLGVATAEKSHATTVFDLRAISATGTAVVSDSKTVTNASVGDVITYQIVAQISGAAGDTRLEGFQASQGTLQSSGTGTIQVNLTHTVDAAFDDSGFSNGTPTNLGGDSDTDIGVNPAANNTGNIITRSASMTLGNASGLGTSEFLIGTGTMTVTATSGLTPTTVAFTLVPPGPTNPRPAVQVDGTSQVGAPAGATVSPGVTISAVPEPTALALLGLGGLAALRRRRA